jgi:hypothetical protein
MRPLAVLSCLLCLASAWGFAQAAAPTGTGTSSVTPPPTAGAAATPAPGAPAAAGAAAAPAAAPKPDDLPRDASAAWRVGICGFSSSGLSTDNAYLPYSLPLLLKNELAGLTEHLYGEEEIRLARRFLVAAEVRTSEKALTAARKDRDTLLFNEVDPAGAAWAAANKRISDAIFRIAFLRALDPERIPVNDHKPVTIVEGSGAGKLLPVPDVPPAVACAQQGLDLLVGGSVQEVQGYLLLDVWAFDPLSGTNVFRSRNAASREELYASVPVFGREIARTILGRAWTLVAFAPDPPETSLYVDGTLVASGATPVLYLLPGNHAIRLSATGYHDVTREVYLVPEQETRITDALSENVGGAIAVASDPPGADVYLDSYWLGKTPLDVQRPPVRSRGVLSLKGFYDAPFSLEPASAEHVTLQLQKDIGPRDAARTRARDDFYGSLGIFAFSLPVPAFAYGFAIDFALKAIDLPAGPDAAQAAVTSQVFLGVYYAGIAVSAALFTWMVTRIVHYVSVANEIAN